MGGSWHVRGRAIGARALTLVVAVAAALPASSLGASSTGFVQLAHPNGCLVAPDEFQPPIRGCRNNAVGLQNASSMTISPDGGGIYVASGGFEGSAGAVATLRRGTRGRLVQPAGPNGCISDANVPPVKGCAGGDGLLVPSSAAVSPDSRNVYVASSGNGSLAIFSRNISSSVLTQLPQPDGCIDAHGPFHESACQIANAIGGAQSVAVSPDGENVYVTTFFGLAIFSRNPTDGSLTQLPGQQGCIDGDVLPAPGCAVVGEPLDGAETLAISPDGRYLYVVTEGPASQGGPSGLQGALLVFARNPGDGSLTLHQCIIDRSQHHAGCVRDRALLRPFDLALSSNGKHVYVLPDQPGGIDVFDRRADGRLRQPAGRRACIVARQVTHAAGCRRGIRQVSGIDDIAVKRGNLYVAGGGNNTVGIFARERRSGALRQRRPGCIGKACHHPAKGLVNIVSSVLPSPHGDNLYTGSSEAVAAFRRR